MREIVFRGKDRDNKWLYGSLNRFTNDDDYIQYEDGEDMIGSAVDKETVGQYTGRVDQNNEKIFEGDLVYLCNANHDKEDGAMLVIFENGEFAITGGDLYVSLCECYSWELEVVGNKFDNPELLEVIE